MWGDVADRKDLIKHNILAIKQAKVSEFNGLKTLTIGYTTQLYVNPADMPECKQL